jgi:HlyD family secretion protein
MKRFWLLLLAPLLLILWWGLDHNQSAPVVHFVTVRPSKIESTISTNGKVEPAEWAAARAETAGVIRSIHITRGERVATGQILVSLDDTAARAELAAAQAKVEEARAESTVLSTGGRASQLASLNASIQTAQTAIEVAQRNYESMQRLQNQQAATKYQVQEAKDALDRARQQLSAFQEQRRTLVTATDKEVAQARLADALSAVRLAQHRLTLSNIRSPGAGTVYQFDLKVGAYLQPGDLVALIGNLDQVKVIVYVDEPDLGRLAPNLPVSINWDAKPGQKWWGHIDKLPTAVIALGTRTVGEVTTIIDNPNHDLLPGVSVNATIISKIANQALSIPKTALRTSRGEHGVYKLSKNTLIWTPVQTGLSDVNNVQISSGIAQGDHVADRVVDPSDAEISNGIRVKPQID